MLDAAPVLTAPDGVAVDAAAVDMSAEPPIVVMSAETVAPDAVVCVCADASPIKVTRMVSRFNILPAMMGGRGDLCCQRGEGGRLSERQVGRELTV